MATKKISKKSKSAAKPRSPKTRAEQQKPLIGGVREWMRLAKERIAQDTGALDFMIDVAAGRPVRAGPPTDPTARHYPSFRERMDASTWLLGKLLPNVTTQQITGDAEQPVAVTRVEDPRERMEIARRMAFLLTEAATENAAPVAEPLGAAGGIAYGQPHPMAHLGREPEPSPDPVLGEIHNKGDGWTIELKADDNGAPRWHVVKDGEVLRKYDHREQAEGFVLGEQAE